MVIICSCITVFGNKETYGAINRRLCQILVRHFWPNLPNKTIFKMFFTQCHNIVLGVIRVASIKCAILKRNYGYNSCIIALNGNQATHGL